MALTAEQVAQELQALRQELQESRRREEALAQTVQTMQAGPALSDAVAKLVESQSELLEATRNKPERLTLVDNRGLGKPEKFGKEESRFLQWKVRFEAFVTSIHPDLEGALSWAEDQEDVITEAMLLAAFGEVHPSVGTMVDRAGKDAQLFAALQTLCEAEAFSVVRSSGRNNGLEAWRRLNRRFDPATGGRRKALLRSVLSPNKVVKLEDLSAALETWEETVRQFEQRRKPDGTRTVLDGDIKVAVLEALCPVELEKHLQLNRSRLVDYDEVRAEVVSYLETRTGNKIHLLQPGMSSKDDGGTQPMDVGALGSGKGPKGGKKGGKKGDGKKGKPDVKKKETRACFNCGKVGHVQADCWAKPKGGQGSGKGGQPKRLARPKGGKPKGKGHLHNVEEEEPEAEGEEDDGGEANFLSIAGLTEVSLSSDSDEEALLDMSRPYGSADVRGAKDEPNVKEDPEAPASSSSAAGPSQTAGQTEPDSSKVEPKEEEMKEEGEVTEAEESDDTSATHFSVEPDMVEVEIDQDEYIRAMKRESSAGSLHSEGPLVQVNRFDDDDDDYVEVCMEPCTYCYVGECDQVHDDSAPHICATCRVAKMAADHRQRVLLWTPLEAFEYAIDKTICVMRGMSLVQFKEKTDEEKGVLRDAIDPDGLRRLNQDDILKHMTKFRSGKRHTFLKKRGLVAEGASGATGPADSGQPSAERASGSNEPASGSRDLPARPTGSSSTTLMHRTIELMEIANLGQEKKEKAQLLEVAETPLECEALERRIKEIDTEVAVLKARTKEADSKAKARSAQLTKENVLDQSWHDSRYQQAIAAGVSHSAAWLAEKKRRKAALHRREGVGERARERLELDEEWHRIFDSMPVKEEEYRDDAAPGIETEALEETDDGRLRVLRGQARQVRRGELREEDRPNFVQSARTYRKLTQEEVSRFRTETREDERRVMGKGPVDIHKKRIRVMDKEKKDKRRDRVKAARKAKREEASYSLCSDYVRGACRRGAKCKHVHDEVEREKKVIGKLQRTRESERSSRTTGPAVPKEEPRDLASLAVAEVNAFERSKSGYRKVSVNFDTGAAISAIPVGVAKAGKMVEEASKKCYRTASGEIIEDQGGVVVRGYDKLGVGRCIQGRVTNVHRMLASGSAVAKQNHVLLIGNKGYAIPKEGKIAKAIEKTFWDQMAKNKTSAKEVLQMESKGGIYVFDLWVKDGGPLGALGDSNCRQGQRVP